MQNKEIRALASTAGIRLWQIAEQIGINDGNFSRRLRHELSSSEREHVLMIIKELAAEQLAKEKEGSR